jgi:hypothetical protein
MDVHIFAYDGSWKGFLCLLERVDALDVAPSGAHPQVRSFREGEGSHFREDELVVTIEEDARRMHQRLREHFGKRDCWIFRHGQAAGRDEVDTLLVKLWLQGSEAVTVDERYLLLQWAGRVSFETHRYQGILRLFPLQGGLMYGPVSPDYRILPFLMQWAVDRFPDTPLLLHDRPRGYFRWNLPGRGGFRWNLPGQGEGEGDWLKVQDAFPDLPSLEELLRRTGEGDEIENR